MQIQKIGANYNQTNKSKVSNNATNSVNATSFGHRTAYPVFISDAITAHFHEGTGVFAYSAKVGNGKSIYITRNYDSAEKELVARVHEGDFDVTKLPKKVEEYYQECVAAAKRYFWPGTNVEL